MSEFQAKFLILVMVLLFIGPIMLKDFKELKEQHDQAIKFVTCTVDCGKK